MIDILIQLQLLIEHHPLNLKVVLTTVSYGVYIPKINPYCSSIYSLQLNNRKRAQSYRESL